MREPAEPASFADFGKHLRALRDALGFSLRRASELSREISSRPEGQISDGYLSLLEQGRAGKVGLAKLKTLAQVYEVPLQDLLSRAPDTLKESLRESEEYAGSAESRDGVRARDASRLYRQKDERIFRSLLNRSTSSLAPIGRERETRDLVLGVIFDGLCAPAWLSCQGPGLAVGLVGRMVKNFGPPKQLTPLSATAHWFTVARVAIRSLEWDGVGIVDEVLSDWSLDFYAGFVSCKFAIPKLEERFGVSRLPWGVVEMAGVARVAQFIGTEYRRHFPDMPAPPAPLDVGLRDYLCWLCMPYDLSSRKDLPASFALSSLGTLLAALADKTDRSEVPVAKSVAAYLSRSVEPLSTRPLREELDGSELPGEVQLEPARRKRQGPATASQRKRKPDAQ